MRAGSQTLGNSLKHAAVVLVRVVCCWGMEACCTSLNFCISIISQFMSRFTESLSDVPCQGGWFLGEALYKEGAVVCEGCVEEHLISPRLFILFVSAYERQQPFLFPSS